MNQSKKRSKGACIFCNRVMTKGGLSKHFYSCKAFQEKID